ncbi:7321_t:CDS:2 [Funneliformis geosporum]|nr:7321_t:CDS:2 [Funneliformis geosporum]
MERISSQCESSKNTNTTSGNLKTSLYDHIYNNHILLKLEKQGFITPDEQAHKLIKNLSKPKHLYALKLLFENPLNEFSSQVLRDSLVRLADPTPFDHYSRESMAILELHLRTWSIVLERICFLPMRLSRELRENVYDSLAEFVEIHRKTTRVVQDGIDNNYRYEFNQFNPQRENDENMIKKRNYNIDFLLIHLRDTLHSLRDDETWFQEIIRRTKDLLNAVLNIAPGIFSVLVPAAAVPKNNCSIISMFMQLHQGLSFKYPVSSYYVDWRIMLIIKHNIVRWSEGPEKIISKKFGEMILMEYLWGLLEREWNKVADKTILDSQMKFDDLSNKVFKALKNVGSILHDITGSEPIALPHTLWFGILDLAHDIVKNSTRTATHGLCYYLAIESLNKAPSSFIQFKSIEILLQLRYNELFSIIELDFDQYARKLNETTLTDPSENFQNLLNFVKEKCHEDTNILCDNIGKEKGKGNGSKSLEQNSYLKKEQIYCNILNIIADDMTCPISHEPEDRLCILRCQHVISLDNLKRIKQKKCPKCRKNIGDNDIIFLLQSTIYKNLFKNDRILSSFELDDSDRKYNKLAEHRFEEAEYLCKEFLKTFPKSNSMRCILAYTYRCLDNHKQAHLVLNEAIHLKPKNPISWYIRGEIFFREKKYEDAVSALTLSSHHSYKMNNLYFMLGNSYFHLKNDINALANYNLELQNDPNNHLCLKNCAYIYENQEKYSNTLEMLDRLLNISEHDSLILCYYGEILMQIGKYEDAELYFTKANIIDPENIHNLIKRSITFIVLHKYDKALLDLRKVLQLNPSNNLAYFYKGIAYSSLGDINGAEIAFKKYAELDPDDDFVKVQLYHLEYLQNKISSKDILTKINQIANLSYNRSLLPIRLKICYFLSNLDNIDNNNLSFESDPNSLSGKVLRISSDEEMTESLNFQKIPKFFFHFAYNFVVWKICINKVSSKDCTLIFTVDTGKMNYSQSQQEKHILNYDKISELVGLGWIEYTPPIRICVQGYEWVQPLIKVKNGYIDMKIDYIRITCENRPIYFPQTGHLLPTYKQYPNVPEVFEDRYFSKKEKENLLELNDILNYL